MKQKKEFKNENYVQVKLENVNGRSYMICFIPFFKGLKEGKFVEDDDKNRFIVKEVYLNSVITEEYAKKRSLDYRKHRKATDI